MPANELGNLVVRIGADTTSFTQGIGRLNQQLRLFQSSLTADLSGVNGVNSGIERLRLTSASYTQQIDVQRQRLEVLNQGYNHLVTTQGENSRVAQDMQIRINNQRASLNNLQNSLNNVNNQLRLQQSRWYTASQVMTAAGTKMKAAGEAMASAGRKLSTYVTAPIVAAGVASVKLASDMNETINKVDVVFDKSADRVKAWGDTTLKTFGMAKATSLDMASQFGDMATSMGISREKAAEMSMQLVNLGGDLSSFKNIPFDEIKTALNSIFTGETESIKRLGVVMTEQSLQEYATAQGIKTKVNQMTEAEKVMLRYEYVLSKTKNSQGDFKRTIDSTANQMRLFQESTKQLGATFGQKILPILTPLIVKLNELMLKFANLNPKTQETIIKIAAIAAAIGPVIVVIGSLVSAVGSIVGAFGAASAAIAAAGGVLAVITGPIGIAIAAVAALSAAVIALATHWDAVKKAVKGFFSGGDSLKDDTKQIIGSNIRNSRFGIKIQPDKTKEVDTKNMNQLDNDRLKIIEAQNKANEKEKALNKTSITDKQTFKDSLADFEYKKRMNQLSYQKEISSLKNISSKYAATTEEKRKVDMKLFDIKKTHENDLAKTSKKNAENYKEIEKNAFDEQISAYEFKTKLGKLTYSQEISLLENIMKKYAKTTDQKRDIETKLFDLKKQQEEKLQEQRQKNQEKQQVMYDKQLSALEKIKALYENSKADKANNEHIAYLQDRINRASDPLEKASLKQELSKFKNDITDKNTLNVFDVVKDKITALKDSVGMSTKDLAAEAKASAAAMASVFNMLSKEGFSGLKINNSYNVATAGAGINPNSKGTNSTSNFYITIDAKNVKEFNDVVKIMKDLPTKSKKK